MKIAITGHTAGIGKSLATQLEQRGHEIIGISRREKNNIRRIEHTASLIEPAELFINNAQSNFAQTELFYEIWKRWRGKRKYIWNISTAMTEHPVNTTPDNQDDLTMSLYRNQKLALEEASRQLRAKSAWPLISIIRPGGVATQTTEFFKNDGKYNTDKWVETLLKCLTQDENINITEISISYTNKRIPL